MKKMKERLDRSLAPYKDIYYARLRKQWEVIHEDDYAYRRIKLENTKEHRIELAPTA